MTDDETVKPDYEVGYKRPPKHSQFQKGPKGYLRGKARAENKAKSSMTEAVNKKVRTRDPKGKRRSATLQEVIDLLAGDESRQGRSQSRRSGLSTARTRARQCREQFASRRLFALER